MSDFLIDPDMGVQETAIAAAAAIDSLRNIAMAAAAISPSDVLRLHLISEHAFGGLIEDPHEAHEHEHNGPGTIRNHPLNSRTFTLTKVVKVLQEAAEPESASVAVERLEHLLDLQIAHAASIEQARLSESSRADAAEARLSQAMQNIEQLKADKTAMQRQYDRLISLRESVIAICDSMGWSD